MFPLPSLGRSRTVADITGYCLSKDTEHVDAAADFMAFASGDEALEDHWRRPARSCRPTSRRCTPRSSSSPAMFPRNSEVFDQVIRRADPMPSTPGWPDVVSQTQPYLDRLFYSPVLDLDTLLPRIDEVSAVLLVEPTPSAVAELLSAAAQEGATVSVTSSGGQDRVAQQVAGEVDLPGAGAERRRAARRPGPGISVSSGPAAAPTCTRRT